SLVMPLAKSVLTSPFGMRNSPISGKWKMHTGIDLAAPVGSEVYACKSGKVISCVVGNATFGNYIILQHDNKMTSVYAHLSKMFVSKGQMVSKGAHIANVGLTGMTTGPHLHFEIRVNGNPQDPGKLLPAR
ncbi:MAG: M23 family metallopeptidase, partial [Treponema sp.]|nr:M23 family metallopeptidase [Treponema sp.]